MFRKKTLFDNTCVDVIANIADYLTYEDHETLCKISGLWKSTIFKHTMYFKYIKFVKTKKLSKKNKILQFYYCCSENELDLARDIYRKYSLDPNIISSVFCYKVVEPKYDTILTILKAMNIDYSIYRFLQTEEKYLANLKIIERFSDSLAFSNGDYATISRRLFCNAGSERYVTMEILHCFVREFRERVVENINDCCICTNSIDELEFFCQYLKGGEQLVDAIVFACMCKRMNVLKWMLEREEFKKFASNAFVKICIYNDLLDYMKLIDKAVILSQETLKESFILCCLFGHFENANWIKTFKLKEGISENIRLQIFMNCQKNTDSLSNVQILELIYPIESLQENVLKESFLNACIKGKKYLVKFLFSFFTLPIEAKIEGFINCCLYNHVKLAKFFNKKNRIDSRIIKDAFYVSVYKNNLEVINWLQGLYSYENNMKFALELIEENVPNARKFLLNILNGNH